MAMVTLTMPLLPTAMLPTPTLMSTTTMVSDTMVSAIAATMEERRGRLRLSQRLLLILRLTHGYCMAAMPAMDMVLVMDMPMPFTPMLPTITHSPTSMAAAETTRVVSSHAPEDKLNIDLPLNLSGFCHINCALNK